MTSNQNKTRVLFMGSPEEVIEPLSLMLSKSDEFNFEIIGVVSQPAKPAGRKRVLTDPPLATFAKEQGLTCYQPEKASSPEFLQTLEGLSVDVIVTAAYGQILSQAFIDTPKQGVINIHPSLLPKYRGATPVQSALLNGDTTTGVTVLYTVKALDAGDIILQSTSSIDPRERADALLARLFAEGGVLCCEAIAKMQDPSFKATPQDKDQITHCTKFSKSDAQIDYSKAAAETFNRFRAFYPWPGTFTYHEDKRVVIAGMEIPDASSLNADSGSFLFEKSEKCLKTQTDSGTLNITMVKPAGGKVMDAAAFFNGAKGKDQKFQFKESL